MKKNYINNKEFLNALIEYQNDQKIAKENNHPPPEIPEYIGMCILKIAENMGKKKNFYQYTYKDDMIGDAIENCIRYLNSFNPEKSDNPFAYFSLVVHRAFLRRIEAEATQSYVKYKSLGNKTMSLYTESQDKKNLDMINDIMTDTSYDIIEKFEEKVSRKKRILKEKRLEKQKQKNLEVFMESIE